MSQELLEKGNWVTRLLGFKKAGRKEYMDWYFVGVFKTCQEAYFQGNKFVMENEDLFKKQSMSKVPDRLVIENMDYGVYPSTKCQLMLDFFPDQNGPYMDTEGITRPSFMIKQAKELKHLLNIETTDNAVTWSQK